MPVFLSTDRLQLLLALVSALTGTWWGVGTAGLVLAVLLARRTARHHLGMVSVPTRGAVLAPTQQSRVLDAAGPPRELHARA